MEAVIREATEHDVDGIVKIASNLWGVSPYSEPFCEKSAGRVALACIENGICVVLDSEGVKGFICMIINPMVGNFTTLMAQEVGFWVEPDYRGNNGVELLKYAEQLAQSKGVTYFNMFIMNTYKPEFMAKFYSSMGYKNSEQVYMKVL